MAAEANKFKQRNIEPFKGEKYGIWKFRVRALIAEEGALMVLDEDLPQDSSTWRKAERVAKGIIIAHLSDSMLSFAQGEETTAREIMIKLDETYARQSLATRLTIEKKLLSLKYKNDEPLASHIATFDNMVIEFETAGEKMNEMNQIARLLLSLPNLYDPVVTAIQTISDESLTLQFVKHRLLDYEIKLRNEDVDTSAKALMAETREQTKSRHGGHKKKGKFGKFKPNGGNGKYQPYNNNKRVSRISTANQQ